MIRRALALFGLEIVYVCAWGTYPNRYDAIDMAMTRPIHDKMSVAPYWAKMRIKRIAPTVVTTSGPTGHAPGDVISLSGRTMVVDTVTGTAMVLRRPTLWHWARWLFLGLVR